LQPLCRGPQSRVGQQRVPVNLPAQHKIQHMPVSQGKASPILGGTLGFNHVTMYHMSHYASHWFVLDLPIICHLVRARRGCWVCRLPVHHASS
jgi:hypothetical protein